MTFFGCQTADGYIIINAEFADQVNQRLAKNTCSDTYNVLKKGLLKSDFRLDLPNMQFTIYITAYKSFGKKFQNFSHGEIYCVQSFFATKILKFLLKNL